MANPKAKPEQTAAELDDRLSDSIVIGEESPTDASVSTEADGLVELEASLDAALEDAESRIAGLVMNDGASTTSIGALDEHLADSTPDDLDIRAEAGTASATPEPATTESLKQESESEDIAAETPESTDDDDSQHEESSTDESPSDSDVERDAALIAEDTEPERQEETRAPGPQAAPEPARISDSTDDEREVLLGSDAEAEPSVPKHLSAVKAMALVPRIVSIPLVFVSPDIRDMIGWLALVTAFNAVALWAYLLLLL